MTTPLSRNRILAAAAAIAAACLFAFLPAAASAAGKDEKPKIVALTPFSANTLIKLGIKPVAIGEGAGGNSGSIRSSRTSKLQLSHAANGPNLEQLVVRRSRHRLQRADLERRPFDAIRDLGIRVVHGRPHLGRQGAVAIREIGGDVKQKKRAGRSRSRRPGQIKRSTSGSPPSPKVLMILGVGQTPYAFLATAGAAT